MAKSKIIRDLANGEVDTITALKRAKVLASDLNNDKISEWLDYEISGYPTEAIIPSYRRVQGNLAPMGSAILFEVADKGVNFLDELELSAEDAFSASAPRMGRPNAREEAATDFIRSLLADGRRLASDCEAKYLEVR